MLWCAAPQNKRQDEKGTVGGKKCKQWGCRADGKGKSGEDAYKILPCPVAGISMLECSSFLDRPLVNWKRMSRRSVSWPSRSRLKLGSDKAISGIRAPSLTGQARSQVQTRGWRRLESEARSLRAPYNHVAGISSARGCSGECEEATTV